MAKRLISRRLLLGAAAGLARAAAAPRKRLVFIAGPKSHPFGQHAHYTGCLFMAERLRRAFPALDAVVVRNGWPADPSVLDGADAIVLFMDGGDRHPALPHFDALERIMKRGAGLSVLHYCLTVPKGEPGARMLQWVGGYYETYWSVNPIWSARFEPLPDHPAARGVRPFAIRDEWYFNMRFRENLAGVTPILTARPPDWTRERKPGPHSGNEFVLSQKGRLEHVAWAYQRPEGGRGFALTGAHYHWAFGHDDFRKVVLNGVAWTAGLEIPPDGVPSKTPSWEELMADQEGTPPPGFTEQGARALVAPGDK